MFDNVVTTIAQYLLVIVYLFNFVQTVSAQPAGCTITPVNPATMTATASCRELPEGLKNVTLKCNCMDGNVPMSFVRWFGPNGNTLVMNTNVTDGSYIDNIYGSPYVRVTDTTATLTIPVFNSSYVGTYTCGSRNLSAALGITLNIVSNGDPVPTFQTLEMPANVDYDIFTGSEITRIKYGHKISMTMDPNDIEVFVICTDGNCMLTITRSNDDSQAEIHSTHSLVITNLLFTMIVGVFAVLSSIVTIANPIVKCMKKCWSMFSNERHQGHQATHDVDDEPTLGRTDDPTCTVSLPTETTAEGGTGYSMLLATNGEMYNISELASAARTNL